MVPNGGRRASDPTPWPDYGDPGLPPPPSGPDAAAILYSYGLVAQTFALIGPQVADATLRFAGDNLACQNCIRYPGSSPAAAAAALPASPLPPDTARGVDPEHPQLTVQEAWDVGA